MSSVLTYVEGHRHSLDDITGYDVVRTTWTPGHEQTTIEVMAVLNGSRSYGGAVDLAQRLRAEAHATGQARAYAYAGNRYVCGCREIASAAGRPGVTVDDLEHPTAIPPHLEGLL